MIKRTHWFFSTLLLFTLAGVTVVGCSGTSTGNPMEPSNKATSGSGGTGGGTAVPVGAQLIRAETPREENPQVTAQQLDQLAADNRAFAFELFGELSSATENLFVSPYSVSVALGMTYAGAEGATESEIAEAMNFGLPEPELHAAFNGTARSLAQRPEQLAPDSSGDGFELSIVNQAWGQQNYPFLDSYLEVLAVHYGSGLFAVDFAESEAVRLLINDWVEDQTEQRIEDLLPEGALTVDTRLVLTNAIYFKASWLSEFDPDLTEDGVFQAPAGVRSVPMMQQQLDALYTDGENYQALELPYVSPDVRMLFILPDEGAFSEVGANLDAAFFNEVREGMTTHTTTARLPRFEFESENLLKGALSALGMPGAFTGDANFEGLAGGVEPLWIDQVYHKAFVAVDEQGTEAAAATAVVITTESAKPLAEITFDRPFFFSIYDEPTGQILFLGQLVDPS